MATTINVRLTEPLSDFVREQTGDRGEYDNTSEYVRDLIRRDRQAAEKERFETLKAELQRAFTAPRERYRKLDFEKFMADMNQST